MTTAMSAHQEPPREHLASPAWPTKRNKRKDFKPRCAPNAPVAPHPEIEDGIDSDPSRDRVYDNEEDMEISARLSEGRTPTDAEDPDEEEISKCVKIGVKNLVLLKGSEAVDLSGRRISTDSNENIDTSDFDGSQHILDFAEHRKRMDALKSLNISSQFQQSYIQSLQLPNMAQQGKHLLTANSNATMTPSEYKTKNFSTKSPFAISQLIKTNSPTRRRNSDNSEDMDNEDGSIKHEDDSPAADGVMSPETSQHDGREPMEVDDCVEEDMQNGDAPNNNKVLRDYAVNTMKELLGIYGLSSNEVAEALTGQVRAIEAMQAGKPYPMWLQHRWSQGAMNAMNSLSAPYSDERETQSPVEMNRSNSIQDDSGPSGLDSDGDRTLDLSVSKDPDVQDLSASASSAGNSVAEFEQTLLMRRNLEDLAGLHGIFSKPHGAFDADDPIGADLRAKLSPAALLASLGQLDGRRQQTTPALDYSRYVKRYGSALECGSSFCKDLGYREHFHCMDCSGRVFCKKEEMIRHFKWHKKRDDSLAHGFMRYSPLDDCGERGAGCPHNRSQTHYHCIQDGCDKVYISTSDVQMHANYHRKDSAILQEGFQRFRATERCSAPHCAFRGQRTTHFHCRRPGCRYTFKNKADMEKHKTYHIKDEQLARDGFKKYMKNEPCPYRECRFSRMCNHIHCIRPRCNYVLHSSSQLFSHKRKHERKEQELNYSLPSSVIQNAMFQTNTDDHSSKIKSSLSPKNNNLLGGDNDENSVSGIYGPPGLIPMQVAMDLTASDAVLEHHQSLNQLVVDEITKKYIFTFNGATDPNDKCQKCSAFNKHFHCMGECCNFAHSCQSTMMKHALEHEHQNQVTEAYFQASTKNSPCNNSACQHIRDTVHFHCTWENCGCVILPSEDQPFRRLEHHRQHAILSPLSPPLARLAHALNSNPLQNISTSALQNLTPSALQNLTPSALQALTPSALQNLAPVLQSQIPQSHAGPASSLDEMFSRKRGRPPKNRVVEVWADHATPQAIFTSFKLPKNNQMSLPQSPCAASEEFMKLKFQHFDVYTLPDTCFIQYPNCPLKASKLHMHCGQCSYSSDNHTALETHCRENHSIVQLLEGFDYYSNWEECNTRGCCKNQLRSHFHCTQTPQCGAILTQYSSLLSHKHIGQNANMKLLDVDVKSEIVKSAEEVKDYSIKGKDSLSGLLAVKAAETVTALENFQGGTLSLKSENTDGEMGPGVVKAAGTFYPSSHERTAGSSPPVGARTPTCPHCHRPSPDHAHLCPAHPPTYDTASLGLAATKETLEREYPEISILPSTASSTGAPPSPAQRQSNQNQHNQSAQSNQSGQAVQSLLLQQYLAQASGKTALQDPLKYQQLGLTGIPGLTPSQLAQMAFLSHRSSFPLYPGMMYPPELLMEQSGMLGVSQMPTSSVLSKNDKEVDIMGKRSHNARGAPSMRMLKDEPIPDGYLRFRFNEDCAYQHCGYREHQTHFHCTRRDCGYSFCDKTRFVQHTARHERLDTLMGGDFQQYRANVFCGRQDCIHASNFGATQNKASHFHCLKCDFVCTDTNKVVAHRRQHQKMDSIQAAGFEKFPPSKGCGYDPQCIHSKKQTHYHCLQCGFAVLGLSQMTSHKYRHQENAQMGASTSGN